MRYKIRYRHFRGKWNTNPFREMSEEIAQKQYRYAITSLNLCDGGFLQLFEEGTREPIKAERIGYDRVAMEMMYEGE